MTDTTLPDWLTVGANVAISSFGTGSVKITHGVVERINKASIVVEGERYPLRGLTRRWGGTWGHSATLCDPADPIIVARLAHQGQVSRLRAVEDAALQCLRDFDANAQTLRDAITRLAPHLGLTITKEDQP